MGVGQTTSTTAIVAERSAESSVRVPLSAPSYAVLEPQVDDLDLDDRNASMSSNHSSSNSSSSSTSTAETIPLCCRLDETDVATSLEDQEDDDCDDSDNAAVSLWTRLIPDASAAAVLVSSSTTSTLTGNANALAPVSRADAASSRRSERGTANTTSRSIFLIFWMHLRLPPSNRLHSRSSYDERCSKWGLRVALLAALLFVTAAPSLYRRYGLETTGTASTMHVLRKRSNGTSSTMNKRHRTAPPKIANAASTVKSPRPQVAWLLVYAGSERSSPLGESTLELVERLSGATTASNYAIASNNNQDAVVPVHAEYGVSGPFVTSPSLPLPSSDGYILTQTYCGSLSSFCMDRCLPLRPYHEAALDFVQSCTSGRRSFPKEGSGTNATTFVRSVAYDRRIPQRAVHLIRDPFTTVLDRMKLSKKVQEGTNKPDSATISSTETRRWCRQLEATGEAHTWEPVLVALNYTHVPCATEWYRYIQWHNMVVDTVADKMSSSTLFPMHQVWVENYTQSWDTTANDLFEFLQLDMLPTATTTPVGISTSRHAGTDGAWDRTTKQSAARMMYELSSNSTWELIRHYVEPYLDKVDSNDDAVEEESRGVGNSDDTTSQAPNAYDGIRPDKDIVLMQDALAYNDQYFPVSPQEPNDPSPQVVWLLSFPNSGTSYTLMNIEQMANVTTGSNYAKDWSVAPLVDSNSTQGPFLHKPELSVPRNVLTKTHCYGYCDDCPPRVYVASTERKFEDGCLRSELPNHGGDGMYKASIPQKAVHLFRNPFDNIVARMHLAVKKREKMGWSPEQLASFGNSKEGLDAWCEYLDDKYAHAEADYFPLSLRKQYLDSLPCHADWYRYVMWHNHAFALSKKLKIPVHTLYYEDYTLRFDETVADLLHFLELSPRQPPVEFYVGKSYEHFFEASHARKAAALVQGLGSKETWEHTRHYFEPYLTSTP